ncbi:MAG: hypothetical protein LBF97_02330 [Elusimicrobiota bacterium]|nr:hypothetical protein [Elusimicrobiota bacterium]
MQIENINSLNLDFYNTNINTNIENFVYKNFSLNLYNGNCLELFKIIPDNSIDFILTDPPYFLDKLDNNWHDKIIVNNIKKSKTIGGLPVGMKFDKNQGRRLQNFFYNVSRDAIRVLKPGAFMIAFSQGRLIHRLAVAAEDIGFEIRDLFIWEHDGGQGKAFTQNHFVQKRNLNKNERDRV